MTIIREIDRLEFPPRETSRWRGLLDRALLVVDEAVEQLPETTRYRATWTLGGQAAIALAIGHRSAQGIDINVSGIPLKVLTPEFNKLIATQFTASSRDGFCVYCDCVDGVVRFFLRELESHPTCTLSVYKGRTIALETPVEIAGKMVPLQTKTIALENVFDIAAVGRACHGLANRLGTKSSDRLEALADALQRMSKERPNEPIQVEGATDGFRNITVEEALDVVRQAMDVASIRGGPPQGTVKLEGSIIDTIDAAIKRVADRPLHFRDRTEHLSWIGATLAAQRIASDPSAVEALRTLVVEWGRQPSERPGLRVWTSLLQCPPEEIATRLLAFDSDGEIARTTCPIQASYYLDGAQRAELRSLRRIQAVIGLVIYRCEGNSAVSDTDQLFFSPRSTTAGSQVTAGDRFGSDERGRVNGPGLRTFLKLALRWDLTEAEQVRILRAPSAEQLRVWRNVSFTNDALILPIDLLMRISAVIGLFGDLQQITATVEEERRWLRGRNTTGPFRGRVPIEILRDGTLENMLDVRRYVLAIGLGGHGHVPNEVDRDFHPYTVDDLRWH
jgi:hypothetical protein